MRFQFVVVVWGDRFLEQLCEICLPCVLAPGNLAAIPASERHRFLFVTRASDVARLKNDRVVQKLGEVVPVEFLEFDPGRYANAHLALAAAHRMVLERAAKDAAYCVVLGPDLIFSSNTLASLRRMALAGKSAVMVSGLRLTTETAMPALRELRIAESYGDNPILAPRNLMRFAMRHFHPEVARFRFDSPSFTDWPVVSLWPVGDEGLVDRSFHLHPLLLDMREARAEALISLDRDTIDGAYVCRAFPDRSKIYVEQDSDNILVFSFSSASDCIQPMREQRASIALLRQAAFLPNVNALHRSFFDSAIRLHTGELTDQWSEIERSTATLSQHFRPLLHERSPWLRPLRSPRELAIFALERVPPLRRAARFLRSRWRAMQATQ
jgi:hypothetical protein